MFVKATKAEVKSRIAITGPSGSGKTLTALMWARELAGPDGKIAVIDTERDSAKLYADMVDFDTLSISPPYHPDRLVEILKAAESEGYAVVVSDSLSHFYNGAGGLLEIVDNAATRGGGGNNFAGWREGTPIQQRMVDALLNFNGHIVSTMRSKTEYALERDDRGKMVPKKLGMAAIQRDGIEYEFTIVLEMDTDHNTIVGKTRCDALANQVFGPGKTLEAAKIFAQWLKSGDPFITDTERNALDEKIRVLKPEQRRLLKEGVAAQGLPKLANLTDSRLAEYRALIDEVASLQPEEAAPETTEDIPE